MNSPCENCSADIKVCKDCVWYNHIWYTEDEVITILKAINNIIVDQDFWREPKVYSLHALTKITDILQVEIDNLRGDNNGD